KHWLRQHRQSPQGGGKVSLFPLPGLHSRFSICLFLALLLLPACQRAAAGSPRASSKAPLSQSELPTTDGAIALGNLEAQIDGEQQLATYRPLTPKQRAAISDLIAMRGQFLGRIADYERAAALAEDLVRDAPGDALAFLARAKARAIFH